MSTPPLPSPLRDILLNSPLLANLPPPEIDAALTSSKLVVKQDGAFYFMDADPATHVYILLEGKIKLTQLSPDGQQVILGYLSPGREFGIIAALQDAIYPVSAQAVGECRAFAWQKEAINQLMLRSPTLALNAMRIMARQLKEFQHRIQELSTQRVERRIARTVLRLAQQSGRKITQGVLIDLPITRQDLAEMTGATLFTVSRTLKQWERQGLVRSKRTQVIILNTHGLVTIAEDLP